MSKGSKTEKVLTKEERLAQALVPVEEQPYPVPENWMWVHWGNCGYFIAGNGFKNEYQGFIGYNIPFYKVGSLKYIDSEGYLYDMTNTVDEKLRAVIKASLIPVNSILFAKIGEAIRLNRRALNRISCCIDNNMMAFVPSICNYKYVLYWSRALDLYCYTNATTVPAIRKGDLEKVPFPFAPLPEQQRIVNRIESLFAKLDEAKEKAQAVVDSFETRKAAILHKAFTGELTYEWRTAHNVANSTWITMTLQDICEKITCGKTPKEFISLEEEIPFLKVYNIVNDTIAFEEAPQFIPRHIHESKLRSSILYPHDVIMNIVGPPLRKIAIIPDTYPEWNMNQAIVRFRPTKRLNYRYLYYALINPETLNDVILATKGVVGQANISVTQSRNLKISVPSLEEQIEIVHILDSLYAKEQQAQKIVETCLEQIEIMKKAILTRAFRGELGTDDPTEESAVELLKAIV